MMSTAVDAGRLLADARAYLAGGVLHHAMPLPDEVDTMLVRGQGSHVWDIEGREYIDYYMGSSAMTLGHAHPEVTAAACRQAEQGSTFCALTPPAVELARRIVEAVPCAERVKFCGTGSEATALALRLARAYTGRETVLKFEGAYHGTHDWAVWGSVHREKIRYPHPASPDSRGVPMGLGRWVLVAPYNDLAGTAGLIRERRGELAAVIAEPLLGNMRPRPGFLAGLREVTRECGIPLIFDEVVTGFRLALGGAQEYYGVVPDLAALGKTLGGGFPIGAVAGRAEFFETVTPRALSQGRAALSTGTYSGNPVSCAAGAAAIDVLRRPGTYERLHQVGKMLGDGVRDISRRLGVPTFVVQEGPMVDLWFTEQPVESYPDTWRADRERAWRFKTGLMQRGVWSPPGLKMFLSLAHTDDDVARTLTAVEASMRELR